MGGEAASQHGGGVEADDSDNFYDLTRDEYKRIKKDLDHHDAGIAVIEADGKNRETTEHPYIYDIRDQLQDELNALEDIWESETPWDLAELQMD